MLSRRKFISLISVSPFVGLVGNSQTEEQPIDYELLDDKIGEALKIKYGVEFDESIVRYLRERMQLYWQKYTRNNHCFKITIRDEKGKVVELAIDLKSFKNIINNASENLGVSLL